MPNTKNNDILGDLDFELPPLPQIKKPADFSFSSTAEASYTESSDEPAVSDTDYADTNSDTYSGGNYSGESYEDNSGEYSEESYDGSYSGQSYSEEKAPVYTEQTDESTEEDYSQTDYSQFTEENIYGDVPSTPFISDIGRNRKPVSRPEGLSDVSSADVVTDDFTSLPPLKKNTGINDISPSDINVSDVTYSEAEISRAEKLTIDPNDIDVDKFDLPPLKKPSPPKNAGGARVTAPARSDDMLTPDPASDMSFDNGKSRLSATDENVYNREEALPDDSALSDIDPSNIILDDMDKKSKHSGSTSTDRDAAAAIKNMVMMDDMDMALDEKPILEDLSNEYTTVKERIRTEDLSTKDKLADNEKQAIKQRMQDEINRRPENFNMKASQAMYNRLMDEKRIKKAKQGFALTLVTMFLGLASAGATFVGIGRSEIDNYTLYILLSIGTALFSLLLMIKAKPVKTLSTLYFLANSAVLAIPGLVMYIVNQRKIDPDIAKNNPDFNKMVIWFAIALIFSLASFIMLVSSKTMDAYYTNDTSSN